MELVELEVSNISFYDKHSLLIGDVTVTLRLPGRQFNNDLKVVARVVGSKSQTLEEIEAALFAEAISVLGLANQILASDALETHRKGIAERAVIADRQAEEASLASISASLDHLA